MNLRKMNALLESVKHQLTEATSGTVGTFLIILKSKLTQYDQALSAKEAVRGRTNIYRLGHYLEAAHKVEGEMQQQHLLDRDDKDAMRALKVAIKHNFSDLPPANKVLAQIDAWTGSGKLPKL